MKKILSEDSILLIFVLILVFALLPLTLFLIRGENKRNIILIEYEAEQMANTIFQIYRENNDPTELLKNENLVSFGIYNYSGEPIKTYGNAPDTIKKWLTSKITHPQFIFNKENKSLIMIRPLGAFMLMRGRATPNNMSEMMRGRYHFRQLLYLELDISNFYKKQNTYYILQFLTPIILFLLLLTFIYLFQRNKHYREKMEKQKQLVRLGEAARTLTHEIKNPLGAIKIQTGYMKRVLPKERLTEVEIIEEETERISNIVDKIGDFLRNPRGKPEKIEVTQFIEELTKRFDAKIKINILDHNKHYITFDVERFRSVIENLIKNAIESYEESESSRVVEIEISSKKNTLTLKIMDSGKGIQEENIETIFDPFFTTKTKGSGLGLALVKRFIEASEGSISIKNRENGGTEISIHIPEVTNEGTQGEG